MTAVRTAALTTFLAIGAALVAPGSATAASDPTDGGLWYLTRTGVADAHERSTGEGITIAVIDGPVNPAAPDLVGANLVVRPSFCIAADGVPAETSTGPDAEHATGTAALLVGTGAGAGGEPGVRGVAPGATVLSYSVTPLGWYEDDPDAPNCIGVHGPNNLRPIADSIDDAVAQGADIISMAYGGIWDSDIGSAVARAYAAGAIIVAAPQNDGGVAYPALGNGVVMVEMADLDANLVSPTTRHDYLAVVAPGVEFRWPSSEQPGWTAYERAQGTSMATPWTAGVLALAWSQHPDATGNQMIQALIRNTTIDNPDLEHHDQWGYGPVDVAKLMAADPTQYPDENPFLRPLGEMNGTPSTDEILAVAGEGEPTPSPSAEPTDAPSPTPSARADGGQAEADGVPVLPIALGVGGLLVVGGVATVLIRRRTTHPAEPVRRDP